MSVSNLNNVTNIKNENGECVYQIKKENSNYPIDMEVPKKEKVTPDPVPIANSKEIVCVDMENDIETQVDLNDQLETEQLVNLSELTAHVISQRAARRKFTIKGLYEYMLGYGRQPHMARGIWDRGQPSLEPENAVWMQYGPTQIQVPLQSPLDGPVQTQRPDYTTGPQIAQAQGYPGQGQVYPSPGQGYPVQGQGYPGQGYQGQGYPGQGYPGQGYGAPQSQAYYQGQGYPHPEQGMRGNFPGYPQLTGEPLVYDPQSRNGFVRKVMSIVLLMLIITAALVACVYMTPNLRLWFQIANWEILVPALICLMTANYGLMCSPCGRRCPGSFVCLTLAVCGMSLFAAKVTAHYRTTIILYAVIATAAVVMVCFALAFTKFDFTSYALYIIGVSVAFSVIVLIIVVVSAVNGVMMKPLFIVILIIGTIIQVVVLTMELQMVLGGRTIEISESDYALAAYMIYTSILDIFLKMVHLLGLIDS